MSDKNTNSEREINDVMAGKMHFHNGRLQTVETNQLGEQMTLVSLSVGRQKQIVTAPRKSRYSKYCSYIPVSADPPDQNQTEIEAAKPGRLEAVVAPIDDHLTHLEREPRHGIDIKVNKKSLPQRQSQTFSPSSP